MWFQNKPRRPSVCTMNETEWLLVINSKHIQDKQVLGSKVYVHLEFNLYTSIKIFNRKMAPEREQWYKKCKHVKTLTAVLLAHKEFHVSNNRRSSKVEYYDSGMICFCVGSISPFLFFPLPSDTFFIILCFRPRSLTPRDHITWAPCLLVSRWVWLLKGPPRIWRTEEKEVKTFFCNTFPTLDGIFWKWLCYHTATMSAWSLLHVSSIPGSW